MRSVLTFVLAVLLCFQAQAGAWPKEKGTGFVSIASRPTWPQDIDTWTSRDPTDQYSTLYFEYGLTDAVSVGLDLGRSVSGDVKMIGFVNIPIVRPDGAPVLAAQFGMGTIADETVVRPGVSIGVPTNRGWVSLDSVAEINLDTRSADLKLDATWGVNLQDNRKLILQIQSGIQSGDPHFSRLAPSMVMPLTKRLDLEVGGAYGLIGDDTMGVKVGLWGTF